MIEALYNLIPSHPFLIRTEVIDREVTCTCYVIYVINIYVHHTKGYNYSPLMFLCLK